VNLILIFSVVPKYLNYGTCLTDLLTVFVLFDVAVHRHKCLIMEPTRCTNFSKFFLFWNETLHVLDSSSVRHQELFTVHTAMV